MAISWIDIRAKVRGDLWRTGSTGVPDDVADRAIHSSLRDLETGRRWLWLENISAALPVLADAVSISLPADMRSVTSLSFQRANDTYIDPPLQRADLATVQMLAANTSAGWPTSYSINSGIAFVDCLVAAGSQFQLIYTARTPVRLEDAIAAASNVTMDRYQDIVIAGACARVALTYLKDEQNAGRHQAKFDRAKDLLIDEEDEARGDVRGGTIVPDSGYQDMAR